MQSSWSRRAVEIDGPQPSTPCNELAGPPNTTLAQASHSRPEAKCNNRVSTSTREYRNQDAALGMILSFKFTLHIFIYLPILFFYYLN